MYEFRSVMIKKFKGYTLTFAIVGLFACTENKKEAGKNNQAEKRCMDNAIRQDSILASVRNESTRHKSLSQTINEYITGLDSIALSSCPVKFAKALKKHIKAWKSLLPITDTYTDLRGEMHVLFDQIKRSADSSIFNEKEKQIWSTWGEVEKLTS